MRIKMVGNFETCPGLKHREFDRAGRYSMSESMAYQSAMNLSGVWRNGGDREWWLMGKPYMLP